MFNDRTENQFLISVEGIVIKLYGEIILTNGGPNKRKGGQVKLKEGIAQTGRRRTSFFL